MILAVSGVKNSGKTTLITKLIPILKEAGLKVATIKHDGHDFEADVPGTDSYLHMQAGAFGTAVFSGTKYMVVKKQEQTSEQELAELFPEADLILLEGFKYSAYPKIELVRGGNSNEPVCAPEHVIAIVTDLDGLPWPSGCAGGEDGREDGSDTRSSLRKEIQVLNLNDISGIADVILDFWFLRTQMSMIVLAGGLSSRMGCDKADLCLDDRTFLELQIRKGKVLGISDILVSGYRGTRCSERVILDRYEKRGPLGGLEAVLREVNTPYALVLSVDVPLVSPEVLLQLVQAFRKNPSPAMVLKHGERTEPLVGIYRTDLADQVEQEILEGKGSVFAFLRRAGYQTLEIQAPEEQFQNINEPEIYERLKHTLG